MPSPATKPARDDLLTVAALVATVVLSGALLWSLARADVAQWHRDAAGSLAGAAFVVMVALLVYGGLVYQVTRLGWLRRSRQHRRASREEVDGAVFGGDAAPLVVLVPSYKEEPGVVRQTLLSAALQDYPNRRVVLLLDDPPDAPGEADGPTGVLRRLPDRLTADFALLANPLQRAGREFEARLERGGLDPAAERARLAALYERTARWFEHETRNEPAGDHTTTLFVSLTYLARAAELRRCAAALRHAEDAEDLSDCAAGYRRLAATFDVRLEAFERKRYANLSHEPNKAMNLNAYLGLLGGAFEVRSSDLGDVLVPCGDGDHLVAPEEGRDHVVAPEAAWVLTLDADSLLAHDYASRLVHCLTEPGMERVAVIQTPYSAVPGAPGALERVAGATTDVMHLVHQGMTAFGATYWVGANALVRKSALDDVATTCLENGLSVTRFIQDRTVIEDTESSVDLVARGWQLHNYPERLAYSATPPDYGALLVQRRRWANGGLLILPKLLGCLLRDPRPSRWIGGLLRVHYLVSVAAVNVALVVLLSAPFPGFVANPLLPATCLPYFGLYALDLRRSGYRARDLADVYALNLLLTPVNLGGVCKSLQQAVTRRQIAFVRTPKVADRTPAPALYVWVTVLLLGSWSAGCLLDLASGHWSFAAFGGFNILVLAYAVTRFIGWRHALADVGRTWRKRRAATPRPLLRSAPASNRATPGAGAREPEAEPEPAPA